jgi:hypothetical protein
MAGVMNNLIRQIIERPSFDPVARARLLSWNEREFLAFLEENASKVISKLRGATTHEDQRDVVLELFAARAFCVAHSSIIYEPQAKGPDFEMIFANQTIYCEVKRLRETEEYSQTSPQLVDFPLRQFRKAGDVVCRGTLQVKPGYPNVLYVRSNKFTMQMFDFQKALDSISSLCAEGNDRFFQAHGFQNVAHFVELSAFLSVILFDDLWRDENSGPSTVRVKVNPNATHPLPSSAIQGLKAALSIPFIIDTEEVGA